MRFTLCLLLSIFSLAACQSSPTPPPTTTPILLLYNHTPEFSGIYVNTDPTPFGGNMYYKAVRSLEDIPKDNLVLVDKQADRVIFHCDQYYHTGTPIGSVTTNRLCGMRLDGSGQRLLAVNARAAIVSPDHQWIVFVGDAACCSCAENLYAMHPNGTDLINLTDRQEFATVRRCAILNPEWQELGDKLQIRFKAWSGKQDDYPIYSVAFDTSF